MQTKITIRNEAQTCYIDIEGTIGIPEERQFGGDKSRVATYEKFRREVARISEVAATAVIVNIRSTGGDVNDALLIYEALRSLGARITTRCYGYTASAATVIAQAADEGCREISSNALYLIHNSECAVEGNAETLASRAELLHKTDVRLAQLYAQRSGRGEEFYAALMAENNGGGRWLSAEEAVSAGLADRIFDGLMTGVILPEGTPLPPQKGDGAAGGEGTASQQGGDTAQSETIPSARAEKPDKNATCEVVEKAAAAVAGDVVKCAVRRFAHCWDKFMERVRSRRASRRAARDNAETEAAATNAAASKTETATAEEEKRESLARNAVSASTVAFDEGQRRYGASVVRAAEDPSTEPLSSESNALAYKEDARVFSSLR